MGQEDINYCIFDVYCKGLSGNILLKDGDALEIRLHPSFQWTLAGTHTLATHTVYNTGNTKLLLKMLLHQYLFQ